jgi:hypothetical protein
MNSEVSLRITVQDVLGYLAAGMTQEQTPVSPIWKRRIFPPAWPMRQTVKNTRCSYADEAPV